MKQSLLLLTKHYPYGTGEEFIQNEIGILSEHFETVYIIACQVADEKVTRVLPGNVKCFAVCEAAGEHKKRIKFVLDGLFHVFCPKVHNEIKNTHGFSAQVGVLYYTGKVNYMYPRVIKAIHTFGQIANQNAVIYSYWLFDTADIACRLRDDHVLSSISYVVSRAHGFDVYAERNRTGYLPFQKSTVSKLDEIFVCSEDGRTRLVELYPDMNNKINVSYLGTKDNGITDGSSDGVFRIATCSWLAALKRTDLLERALRIVQKKYPGKVQWTCIGSGDMLDEYRRFAENELTDMTVVFKGALNGVELMEFYKTEPVDLFISVSSSEGLPVSIMESQSFGIPSLSTDAGGTREITITGKTGLLIPVNSSEEEIAGNICSFIEKNDEERKRERAACRNFWLDNFCAEKNYLTFVNQIQKNGVE